jgi:hypothetical protein
MKVLGFVALCRALKVLWAEREMADMGVELE